MCKCTRRSKNRRSGGHLFGWTQSCNAEHMDRIGRKRYPLASSLYGIEFSGSRPELLLSFPV
jgi:hypothetical protein